MYGRAIVAREPFVSAVLPGPGQLTVTAYSIVAIKWKPRQFIGFGALRRLDEPLMRK